MLVMCLAETMTITWLVDPEEEITLVDSCRMWLEEQARPGRASLGAARGCWGGGGGC